MKQRSEPREISNILKSLIQKFPANPGSELLIMNFLWARVTGKIISSQSEIQAYDSRSGVITILLSKAAWQSPIIASKNFIVNKIRKISNGKFIIREFRFVNQPDTTKLNPSPMKKQNEKKIDDARVIEAANTIEDETLRAAFLKAYRNYP